MALTPLSKTALRAMSPSAVTALVQNLARSTALPIWRKAHPKTPTARGALRNHTTGFSEPAAYPYEPENEPTEIYTAARVIDHAAIVHESAAEMVRLGETGAVGTPEWEAAYEELIDAAFLALAGLVVIAKRTQAQRLRQVQLAYELAAPELSVAISPDILATIAKLLESGTLTLHEAYEAAQFEMFGAA